jgi:hypothetical protein
MESVKVDKRSTKTPEQLEILRLAREKANAIRAEQNLVKTKLKVLKEEAFQKDKELVEKMERAKEAPPPPEPEEEEIEIVKKPKKKKIVYVSDSEEETEVVKKPKTVPVPVPQPPPKNPTMSRYDQDQERKKVQSDRMRSMLFGRY